MQNAMRERQMAMQIAWSRDLTYWIGGAIGLCALGAILTRNKKMVAPILPLSALFAYTISLANSTFMHQFLF